MTKASVQQVSPGRVALEGCLDRHTVKPLRVSFSAMLKTSDNHIDIDLAKVGRSTSVGLSLLLCCARKAKAEGKTFTFLNMPNALFEMARVSGLDDVLPLGYDS